MNTILPKFSTPVSACPRCKGDLFDRATPARGRVIWSHKTNDCDTHSYFLHKHEVQFLQFPETVSNEIWYSLEGPSEFQILQTWRNLADEMAWSKRSEDERFSLRSYKIPDWAVSPHWLAIAAPLSKEEKTAFGAITDTALITRCLYPVINTVFLVADSQILSEIKSFSNVTRADIRVGQAAFDRRQ